MPSISWCGFLCISSRSLNVPGSDSSALQQRYFSMSPRGRNAAFLPIENPAPPRPRSPDSSSWRSGPRAPSSGRPSRAPSSRRGACRLHGASPGSSMFSNRKPGLRHRVRLPRSRAASSLSGGVLAGFSCSTIVRRVAGLERAVVELVDRGHRRDVAGAEALEALDEELAVGRAGAAVLGLVVVGAGRLAERVQQVVGAVHPAGDVVADEHPVAAVGSRRKRS